MSRGIWTLILLGLVSTGGCCLCAAPYDYCGPDCIGPHCDNCDWCTRVGSVYSPHGPTPELYGTMPAELPPEPSTEDEDGYYEESPGDQPPAMQQEPLFPPDNRSAQAGPLLNRR